MLQAQQDLFPALFQLAQTRLEELQAVILLYKTLGGGWKLGTRWLPEPEAPEEESTGEGEGASGEAQPAAAPTTADQ